MQIPRKHTHRQRDSHASMYMYVLIGITCTQLFTLIPMLKFMQAYICTSIDTRMDVGMDIQTDMYMHIFLSEAICVRLNVYVCAFGCLSTRFHCNSEASLLTLPAQLPLCPSSMAPGTSCPRSHRLCSSIRSWASRWR